jgi:hypothetical protein
LSTSSSLFLSFFDGVGPEFAVVVDDIVFELNDTKERQNADNVPKVGLVLGWSDGQLVANKKAINLINIASDWKHAGYGYV